MLSLPFKRPLAVLIACMFSGPSGAAEPSQTAAPERRLGEVEVVGTSPLPGIGIEEDKLPYDVQSVNSTQLYNSQTLNLTEFMARNLSGVNVNEVQGSPFQADITYRGFRLSSVLGSAQGLSVYLDGVRVNEPFGDVINWDMIPEAAIGNVTLVPGSNPVYGLNTLGGALAFTTQSGLTAPGTEVKVQAGSFGRKRVDVAHGSKAQDGWHQYISATAFDEAGWRDHSPGSLGNVFAKIGRTQNDSNWQLSLLVARSQLRGNGLLPSTSYGDEGGDSPTAGMLENRRRSVYTYADQTRNELNMLTFSLQRVLDSQTELSSVAYLRHSTRTAFGGDAEREETASGSGVYEDEAVINYNNSRQTSYGGSVNLTRLLDSHQLTSGLSFDASQTRYGASQAAECTLDASRGVSGCDDAEGTAGVRGKTYALGLYTSDTWSINPRTHLTGAARFNHAGVSNTITNYTAGVGSDRAAESFTYNSLNPSLGASFKVSNDMTLFGNVGQSNRVPTIIELGCADPANPCVLPTGLQADPYLKQVIARTLELGSRWRWSDASEVTASVYHAQNNNDILFRAVSATGLGYFSNFSKTLRQGLDVSARTKMGPISLQASYNYLHATYQADDELFGGERTISVTRGTRIAGLPSHSLRLSLDWRVDPKLTLGGSTIMTSSLVTQGNEDGLIGADGSTTAVDAGVKGYALLNMHANYEARTGLDYFFRVNNVLDRRYESYGLMAMSMFDSQGNTYSNSADGPTLNRFVAPGAPRNFMVGMRYRF